MKTFRLFILAMGALILGLVVSPAEAEAQTSRDRKCLQAHIREAIEINTHRMWLYAQLSNNRSLPISEKLIELERKVLPMAGLADTWARYFQSRGIPVICNDFVDMAETPVFRRMNPRGAGSILDYRKPDVKKIHATLKALYKNKSYLSLAHEADAEIRRLEQEPRYNCLFRHTLESIRRVAGTLPEYMQAARLKGISSPETLSRAILKSHLDLLSDSVDLDQKAAPLQAGGLMILCQDLPHIPAPY